MTSLDLSASPQTEQPDSELRRQRSRNLRLAAILVSASLALLLLVGTGAFAGYQFLLGGAQPADRLPASVVAYAGFDFKPGLDQQRKLLSLVRKFPKAGTDSDDAGQIVDDLLKKLDIEDVDAERDLASWVGVRAAAGLWLYDDESYVLTAVATTDDKVAVDSLTRLTEKVNKVSIGFVVEDGVALIAVGKHGGLTAVKAAAKEASGDPFSASERFASARKWLGNEHVGSFWMDLDRMPDIAKAAFSMSEKEQAAVVKALKDRGNKLQGTLAFGIRATDFGIEARYRTFGNQAETAGVTDALSRLSAQPASSEVAALIAMPDLKNNPAFNEMLKKATTAGKPLTSAELNELTTLMKTPRKQLSALQQKRALELLQRTNRTAVSPIATFGKYLAALSGATLTVAGSNLRADAAFQVTAHAASAADAKTLAELESMSKLMLGKKATVKTAGNAVTIASSNFVGSGATLASDADFRTVTGDAPAHVEVAVYVNLDALLTGKERDEAGPLRAVGMVSGYEDGEAVGSIRLLVA